ncbi:hypothetical protein, partial [Citrobacter sp. MGH 55]|uniref:hypothetical protein n=1 Tax=Citrobacter sp. MGH 55 TaxID=1439319 RepID=UPI0004A16089
RRNDGKRGRETALRLTARRQFAGVQKAQDTARKKGGVTGTVAASLPLTLRQPGMETRCPEGAGQRQRSWLGAKHDSPGSRREVALSYGL